MKVVANSIESHGSQRLTSDQESFTVLICSVCFSRGLGV